MNATIATNIPLGCTPSNEMGIEYSGRYPLLERADREAQARFVNYQNAYNRARSLDAAALQASVNKQFKKGQTIGEEIGAIGVSALTAVSWWRGWNLPFASLCPAPIRFVMATLASIGAVYSAKITGRAVGVLLQCLHLYHHHRLMKKLGKERLYYRK